MWFFTKKDPVGDFVFLIEKMSFKNYLIRSDENWVLPYFFFKNIFKNSKQSQNQNKLWFQQFGDNLASINSPFAGDYDAKMKFYCQK